MRLPLHGVGEVPAKELHSGNGEDHDGRFVGIELRFARISRIPSAPHSSARRPCGRRGRICPLTTALPASVGDVVALLDRQDYVADRPLATAVFLALKMQRPRFLEGEAGVGKTELAKVLAAALGRPLIRLQCYEGLDVNAAAYEWNYPRQMIEIRLAEAGADSERHVDRGRLEQDIFAARFLLRRPLLDAISPEDGVPPVLLIDELDRADEPFEA